MMEAIERIQTYTSGKTKMELKNDAMALDAVVWNLTVLGEAARTVPEEIVNAYPQLPWPRMRGIRNRIVHGYDRIDFDIIWNVVRAEIAPLVPELERILQEADE